MSKRVLPAEAADLLNQGWTYLDVRSVPEFDQGHPTGALNIPLLHAQGGRMVPNPDFVRVVEATFPKGERLVVGCKSGGRSLQAAALLGAAGYTTVVDMRGGFHGERDPMGRVACAGWLESGLPTNTTADPEKTYAVLATKTK
ncbi:MAG TPA: rhodanese-like domain-containing protein [Polyangia bacterium]|jgi:rhodanese-related sulfurtransferase|nr:rhodanese-like domain-containing protein [Polyangia bacterium]